MWLRDVHKRLLTRGFAVVLAAIVCGGAFDWGHVGGDDPDCNVVVVQHNHNAHRLNGAPGSTSSSDHCYICHSLRLLHVGLTAGHARSAANITSTRYFDADASAVRHALNVVLASRAPPASLL
jgi:hypothetical protein